MMNSPRNDMFVPLTAAPASAEKREFRVSVIPQQQPPAKFQTLQAAAPGAAEFTTHRQCEPQVTLQRDGDRVTSIRVQCSCGQVIDLACVYDEKPSS